jgi:hypothetical protein
MSLLKTFTFDLSEAPEDIEERIEENRAAEDALHEKVEERYGEEADERDGDVHPWDIAADEYYNKFVSIQEQRTELEAQKERIEEMLSDDSQAGAWSDHEFTFKEPSTEDAMFVQGRSSALAEEAEEKGVKVDGRAFGITEFLERVCVDRPPEAPKDLAASLPNYAGQWLIDRLNDETMVGTDTDLGNLSPREAAEKSRQ